MTHAEIPLPTPPPEISNGNTVIPLIDFAPLLSPSTSPALKLHTSQSILRAFTTSGFLYLTNYPIPPTTLNTIFAHSAAFFARPQSQKDTLAWTTPSSNRGYVTHGREKVSNSLTWEEVERERAAVPDLKESMEIGRDDDVGHANRWPDAFDDEGVAFRDAMRTFFGQCKEMHRLIMGALARGLGLDEGFFDDYVKQGDNTLRLLHYPPVKKSVFGKNKGQVRAGEHSDFGSVTLLFQDERGGLQVRGPGGGWEDVKPIEGACVVNAGDLLQRWSNDFLKSTMHRVVEPPLKETAKAAYTDEGEDAEYPARYSIAYFCNPDFDKWIEALPGTWGGEMGEKKYEGINSGEYLVQRLSATY